MEEVEQRKALFYLNGFSENQKNLINFQGSNLKFFTQLTDLLMSQGKDSLVYFLDRLVEKEWIGKDYQHKIEEIKSSIRIEKKTSKTVSLKSFSRLALLGLGIFLSIHFARNSQNEYAVVLISITFLICVFWNLWINLFDRFDRSQEAAAIYVWNQLSNICQITQINFRLLLWDYSNPYYRKLFDYSRTYINPEITFRSIAQNLEEIFVSLSFVPRTIDRISSGIIKNKNDNLIPNLEYWNISDLYSRPQDRYIAIIGGPKSGKTILLKYLILICLATKKGLNKKLNKKLPLSEKIKLIPLLISLEDSFYAKKIAEFNNNQQDLDLVKLIYYKLKDEQFPVPEQWLAKKISQRKCLILIDGLDKVIDETQRCQVVLWLKQQMEKTIYRDNRIIITSRPIREIANLKEFFPLEILEIQQFNLEQIREFTKYCCQLRPNKQDIGLINYFF